MLLQKKNARSQIHAKGRGMISTWQYHRWRQSKDEEIMAKKRRNYSVVTKLQAVEVAEKTPKEAILDHSNGKFVVILRLYWQFSANCRHPDSFIDVVAFDNTHFVVVVTVVLTRHVWSAWGLTGGRWKLWFIIMNKHLSLINTCL